MNLQKFKEVYTGWAKSRYRVFYTQKVYYQLVARLFHIYCTQPLQVSVMYAGHLKGVKFGRRVHRIWQLVTDNWQTVHIYSI